MAGTDLVVVPNGSLTSLRDEEPTIFAKFRELYHADWAQWRKVYWYERGFGGRTILRQKLTEGRISRKEDRLLKIFNQEVDLDVLKLVIATANSGKIMTGGRWEIYDDFACSNLVAYGRFDIFDLLPQDRKRLAEIVERGIIGFHRELADWDFDGLMVTHVCPCCHKVYGQDLLAFVFKWMKCEHCGLDGESTESRQHQVSLVKRLFSILTEPDPGRFTLPKAVGMPAILYYLDFVATPIICWLLTDYCLLGADQRFVAIDWPLDRLEKCFDGSVLRFLANQQLRRWFIEFFDQRYVAKLAKIEAGEPIQFVPEGRTEAEIREYLMRSWRETRKNMHRDIEALADVREFLFERHLSGHPRLEGGREREERLQAVRTALDGFAVYMEEALVYVWEELENKGGDT